ncbi:MAG: zinc-dependent metalloprotease, partial [Bacteriovoracaceae bacterium]|nr:zinc-dependent metalloprotease [Bacteriovoracaceae bacterium]
AFYNSFPFLNNDNATYISKHDFSKPRTYYLTKNIPKNLRESFVDGINYWNNIFGKQNIVIKDAYKGIRPWHPGVNLVEFIDDKTNGASSGSMTLNPETGEIMGSYVYVTSGFLQYALEMGSQVGTDHNLDSEKLNEFKVRFQEDYIRQTVAHEIGHSLGIRHNFAGSEGRDFDLSKFPKILKDYVLSDKIHPELISTTTLMDYLHIKFFALIGAKIRQQTKPLPYDKAMIEFGYNSGSIPSDTPFCLRKSLDTVLDFNGEKITCKKWDPEI